MAVARMLCLVTPQGFNPLSAVAPSEPIPAHRVPVTAEFLRQHGGVAHRAGQNFQITFTLRAEDEDGALSAVDLSGLDGLIFRLRIWNILSGATVATRTSGVPGPAGAGGPVDEIQPDLANGAFVVSFASFETIQAGRHAWQLSLEAPAEQAGLYFYKLLGGVWEIAPAIPIAAADDPEPEEPEPGGTTPGPILDPWASEGSITAVASYTPEEGHPAGNCALQWDEASRQLYYIALGEAASGGVEIPDSGVPADFQLWSESGSYSITLTIVGSNLPAAEARQADLLTWG